MNVFDFYQPGLQYFSFSHLLCAFCFCLLTGAHCYPLFCFVFFPSLCPEAQLKLVL